MIISDAQVRLAVKYLQTTDCSGAAPDSACTPPEVSEELLARVRLALDQTPDTREDRVDEARALIAGTPLSSVEVAEKMIGRIISDSIR